MATTTAAPAPLTPGDIAALYQVSINPELMRKVRQSVTALAFDVYAHAAYTAYLCTMCDHACQCLAMAFEDWKAAVLA